ncbi:MAG: hypothetical protein P8049_02900 [Gemmatimonadota bacterium]
MTDEREPQGSVPTVYGRRPYEIQAQEYYPLDSGTGGGDATDPKRRAGRDPPLPAPQ